MHPDSFEQARHYAQQRLERELSRGLTYHSLEHTSQDVVPAAQVFAGGEGIQGDDLTLLLTAAWFHDLSFIEVRAGHEAVGIRLAAEVLPGLGYSAAELQVVAEIIQATVVPQQPTTLLEKVMADADLDVLGRDDFWPRNVKLRQETAFFGKVLTDAEWYAGQLTFVASHTYCTATARALRDAGQLRSVALLRRALEESNAGQ